MPEITDQPPPSPNDRPAVWGLVIDDMRRRDQVGRERYGTPLQPHNGRDALVDAYQEALDLAVYLRQEIAEREDLRAERDQLRRAAYDAALRLEQMQLDETEHGCVPRGSDCGVIAAALKAALFGA